MANVISGQVWTINAPATVRASGNTVAVHGIEFVNTGTAAAGSARITDAAGVKVWEGALTTSISADRTKFEPPLLLNGFIASLSFGSTSGANIYVQV